SPSRRRRSPDPARFARRVPPRPLRSRQSRFAPIRLRRSSPGPVASSDCRQRPGSSPPQDLLTRLTRAPVAYATQGGPVKNRAHATSAGTFGEVAPEREQAPGAEAFGRAMAAEVSNETPPPIRYDELAPI